MFIDMISICDDDETEKHKRHKITIPSREGGGKGRRGEGREGGGYLLVVALQNVYVDVRIGFASFFVQLFNSLNLVPRIIIILSTDVMTRHRVTT